MLSSCQKLFSKGEKKAYLTQGREAGVSLTVPALDHLP